MVWKACERVGIRPPGIESDWHENLPWNQALIIAYSQIRDIEENEINNSMMKAMFGVK